MTGLLTSGRMTYGSWSSLPPACVTTASSREVFDALTMKPIGTSRGKIGVLVAGLFEAPVEVALDFLPDGVAMRLDHHAAFDHLGRLRQVALANDVNGTIGRSRLRVCVILPCCSAS